MAARSPYDYAGIVQSPSPPPPSTTWPNTEAIDDRVADLLVAGDNITLDYDDAAGRLTISATAQSYTVSTEEPSGGVDGDIWYQVPA